MNRRRAFEITAVLTETGATLPPIGRLLPDLLGEPTDSQAWRCVRCDGELVPPARYACTTCLARDAEGERWIGRRPKQRGGPGC